MRYPSDSEWQKEDPVKLGQEMLDGGGEPRQGDGIFDLMYDARTFACPTHALQIQLTVGFELLLCI